MAKSEFLKIRLEPEEKEAFEDAANFAGISLSAWIRERLRTMARKELDEAGEHIAFLPRKGRVVHG